MNMTLNGRTVCEMTSEHSGLVTKVQTVAPVAVWTHCMIHRQALVAKKMSPMMKQVMDEAVRTVNAIKMSATSTELFKDLCQEMGATSTAAVSQ